MPKVFVLLVTKDAVVKSAACRSCWKVPRGTKNGC